MMTPGTAFSTVSCGHRRTQLAGTGADDLLRHYLGMLPVIQRVIIEYVYGVWGAPVDKSVVACALEMTEQDLNAQ